MKNRRLPLSLVLIAGAMLFVAGQARAYYTNYLDIASNALTFAYNSITSNPAATSLEKRQAATIKRALKDLSKPSTSVAGDYNLFLAAALHLGPLAFSPQIAPIGSNVFELFTNEAQAEIVSTAARVEALNDFVRVKHAASNQVVKAQATLDSMGSLTDPRVALIVGRVVYSRINAANHLAAIGEAHPGFAPESVVGKTLTHHQGGDSGTVHFDDATTATDADSGGSSTDAYTWTRTGLNTATLVLTVPDDSGTDTITVKITFKTATGGSFTFHQVKSDGRVQNGAGTFTFE